MVDHNKRDINLSSKQVKLVLRKSKKMSSQEAARFLVFPTGTSPSSAIIPNSWIILNTYEGLIVISDVIPGVHF